ncbi:MAG: RnfH family protein [Gammaproteobacteria bacterium]|nr:RnfH family protein [Gammaproteobacteria bacterium]
MKSDNRISVTVCYALPHHQEVIPLKVTPQSTVLQTIQRSGIMDKYPDIEVNNGNVGIFGRLVGLDQPLQDHDRIEIYRPLYESPPEARRRRAR